MIAGVALIAGHSCARVTYVARDALNAGRSGITYVASITRHASVALAASASGHARSGGTSIALAAGCAGHACACVTYHAGHTCRADVTSVAYVSCVSRVSNCSRNANRSRCTCTANSTCCSNIACCSGGADRACRSIAACITLYSLSTCCTCRSGAAGIAGRPIVPSRSDIAGGTDRASLSDVSSRSN